MRLRRRPEHELDGRSFYLAGDHWAVSPPRPGDPTTDPLIGRLLGASERSERLEALILLVGLGLTVNYELTPAEAVRLAAKIEEDPDLAGDLAEDIAGPWLRSLVAASEPVGSGSARIRPESFARKDFHQI